MLATERDLWTVNEVAALFRVTPRTIRSWTASGTLRCVRIGGRVRYRRDTLEELLEGLETPVCEPR